jgi:WD40 repeat protein
MLFVFMRVFHQIWSALTGKLQRVFKDVAADDIGAMCGDDRQTKLVIGDRKGNVSIHNFSTGELLRKLSSHRAEVTFLEYCSEDKCILSAASDGELFMHDDR